MLYQPAMQAKENPIAKRVSCVAYHNEPGGSFPNHIHSFIEIIYLIEGSMLINCGGRVQECGKGDMVFVPSLMAHSLRTIQQGTRNLILQISPNFFHQGNLTLPQIKLWQGRAISGALFAYHILRDEELLNAFISLQKVCMTYPQSEEVDPLLAPSEEEDYIKIWRLHGLVHIVFSLLLAQRVICLGQDFYDIHEMGKMEAVLREMVEYPGKIFSMKSAAAQVSMEYHHFSRRFKELVGFGFSEYTNILRLSRAEELLLGTDLPVTEIAQRLNFGTQSYFNRKFKEKNHITPLQYRRQRHRAGRRQKI